MGVRYTRVEINIDRYGRLGRKMPNIALGEIRCIPITDHPKLKA